MPDSQVRVIADKQVAQITADRKAIPPISFEPLQRTSLMIRTCIDLGTDHLQCDDQYLKRIDATREIRPFLAWPVDLISADPHALIVFWLEQGTGTSVSPDGPITMRRRSATTTAAPLGVLLQTMPLISVSCEPCDDCPAARTITGGAVDELQHQADGQLWQVILCRRCRRFRGSRRSETLIPAAMASDRGTVQLLD